MGKLVGKTLNRNKVKKQYTAQQLTNWYIRDLEDNDAKITKDMKEYKEQISKLGKDASAKFSLELMNHCAFDTENENVKKMLTPLYIGSASAAIIKTKNASLIFDLVQFLEALKDNHEKFEKMKLDYKKYSKAMADTEDLKYNMFWVELFNEYAANYDFLLNSNDAESAFFLASKLDLSKEDFKHCEDVVLNAKDPQISYEFYGLNGARKAKHRKIVVDSKNSRINGYFLMNEKCNVNQVNEHKAAIYSSKDDYKLKSLVLAIVSKPKIFSETEINDFIKTLIRQRKTEIARVLATCEELTDSQLAKLEKFILSSKDISAIKSLQNCKYSEQTRKLAEERENELNALN